MILSMGVLAFTAETEDFSASDCKCFHCETYLLQERFHLAV